MDSFWLSFWSNFLASSLVLFLASVILPQAFRWRDMPSVRLIDSKNRKNKFEFTEAADGQWEATLELRIFNNGRHTLDRYYWEIFIPKKLQYSFHHDFHREEKIVLTDEPWDKYRRISGYTTRPVFPEDTIYFPFRIKIKQEKHTPTNLYYLFRTEYGHDPFWSFAAFAWRKFEFLRALRIT